MLQIGNDIGDEGAMMISEVLRSDNNTLTELGFGGDL